VGVITIVRVIEVETGWIKSERIFDGVPIIMADRRTGGQEERMMSRKCSLTDNCPIGDALEKEPKWNRLSRANRSEF